MQNLPRLNEIFNFLFVSVFLASFFDYLLLSFHEILQELHHEPPFRGATPNLHPPGIPKHVNVHDHIVFVVARGPVYTEDGWGRRVRQKFREGFVREDNGRRSQDGLQRG